MEKKTLLIVDSAETFREALEATLKDEFCIHIANSGEKALEILDRFAPDVMVMDVMLPGVDGISVLQHTRQRGYATKVLATISVRSEYILDKLMQLQVSYVLLKSCSVAVAAERVREIAYAYCQIPKTLEDEGQKLAQILLELGWNPKHNGYRYLCKAVTLYAADRTQLLTKELYVAVGKVYGVSWQQIERSIRGALEAAWKNRNDQSWYKWFPAGTLSALKRPTNGEVICRLAEHFRLEKGRKIG